MFCSRFPVPVGRAWLGPSRRSSRFFSKRVSHVVPKRAKGSINLVQAVVFTTNRQEGQTEQQANGEETFLHDSMTLQFVPGAVYLDEFLHESFQSRSSRLANGPCNPAMLTPKAEYQHREHL